MTTAVAMTTTKSTAIATALLCCAALCSGAPINRFPHLKPVGDYNAGAAPEAPVALGAVTSAAVSAGAAHQIDIACGKDLLRVQFWRPDVVRIWLAWGGNFSDAATADIVTGAPLPGVKAALADKGDYYELTAVDGAAAAATTTGVTLRAAKSPLAFSLYSGAGLLLWAESSPLSRNATATFQSLRPAPPASANASASSTGAAEAFFGGGMQNGRFAHAGSRIRISNDFNWADGGNPNAAPYYASSRGYGVYRNTWAPGYYDFGADGAVAAAHNESGRFDAFYFGAPRPRDFKALLGAYTYLVGPPFMPPVYALGLGDSDCYHNARHGNDTRVVVAVADEYRAHDIPASWFLPNDGYGCGFGVGGDKFPKNFTELDATVAALHERGFETGLWSSTGLPNITREVAGSGTRVAKTDVGWIGAGYKYALDSLKFLTHGIEDNSAARRFIWTVEGWAGTHRYAVMWTGDDSGSFEYLRWQIPTFVGCGFSAQAHVSGDIDGIFGGSAETYVRDLQMKSLMTTLMVMSGWAGNPDKQPWTWGEPYTSINRMYLKLKAALTPYHYSLSREAFDTGVPPVRAMALEFPADDALLLNGTGSAMQFMVGPSLLVAPVYRPLGAGGDARDGIYLPATPGGWVDYWDGAAYGAKDDSKPTTLDGYASPLEKLPLFVRAGAILPMWPASLPLKAGNATTPPPATLTLDLFPAGDSSFELYEDDGVTREALAADGAQAAFLRTNISVSAPVDAMAKGGRVRVRVGAAEGNGFAGALDERAYDVRVHRRGSPPLDVTLVEAKTTLPALNSLDAVRFASKYGGAAGGWYFSKATLGGVLHIAVPKQRTDAPFTLELSDGPAYPRVSMLACGGAGKAAAQAFDYVNSVTPGNLGGKISLRGSSPLACVTVGRAKEPGSGTPAVQMQPCKTTLDSSQVWILDPKNAWLQLRGDTSGHCIDVDMSDHNLEMYGCNKAVITHQQFAYDKATGAFTTLVDNTCMTSVDPDLSAEIVVE